MNVAALKRKHKDVSLKILQTYKKADKVVIIHENDRDLDEIRVKLPKPPSLEKIYGFGKQAKSQKFFREEQPKKLKSLVKDLTAEKRSRSSKPNEVYITVEEIWDYLRVHSKEYEEEIYYIKKQWYHRIYGAWYFIKGKPTYICGWHWFYLNYYQFHDGGMPDYRDRDRKWHLVQEMLFYETKDENGIEHHRVLHRGTNNIAGRRTGKTSTVDSILLNLATMSLNWECGIQGLDKETGIIVFQKHVIYPFRQLPFYFTPSFEGTTDVKTKLTLKPASISIGGKGTIIDDREGLETVIDFASTADQNFYDKRKLNFIHVDEPGKCLKINTLVLMYDGSVKKAQDIIVGDQLMGDDSIPRNVLTLGRGSGQMYDIIPNKGESWGCNEDHVLSLKSTSDGKGLGLKKNDVLNISIKDFFKLKENRKKHLVLYRTGVEYNSNKHILEPYFLGLWLGDGSSSSQVIYNIDKEVIRYLGGYIQRLNREIHSNKYRLISAYQKKNLIVHRVITNPGYYNKLIDGLKKLNLINNKHIPNEYLYDSRENRLNLLAGIIDTDGYRESRKGRCKNSNPRRISHRYYDITLSNKGLSEQILILARSLGFYASFRLKKTSMKRDDGSYFRGVSYRVTIYGKDIYEIPCKVERKKYYKASIHKNTRDSLRTGFKIEKKGIENYYGFNIDRNGLFLLADFTVTHNTYAVDVYKRHEVVKECVAQGLNIIGWMMYTTTVEETRADAMEHFIEICDGSHYGSRTNGKTSTGLINIFIPAEEGLEGFVDEFGASVIETPARPVMGIDGLWITIGSREDIENDKQAYIKDGNFDGLAGFKRRRPNCYRDCFTPSASESSFNMEILESRLTELKFSDVSPIVNGDLYWAEGFGSRVEFSMRTDGKGRWNISQKPSAHQKNQWYMDDEIYFPRNSAFTMGVDPFRFSKLKSRSKSGSKGGLVVFSNYDAIKDGGKDIKEWESNDMVCTYEHRPETTEEFSEDALMTAIYYSCIVFTERNVDTIIKDFERWKYKGFLLHEIALDKYGIERVSDTPGFNTSGDGPKQKLMRNGKDYIQLHGKRCKHADFLTSCTQLRGIEDMTNRDLFTAGVLGLEGLKSDFSRRMEEFNTDLDYDMIYPEINSKKFT